MIIEILKNKKIIAKGEHIFIEFINGSRYGIYIKDLTFSEEISIDKDSDLLIKLIIKSPYLNEIMYTQINTILNETIVLDSNLYFEANVRFCDDYYEYNQDMIDLFYMWEANLDKKNNYIEYTRTYNMAAMIYSGIPNQLKLDKPIIIDNNKIFNKYHLLNILGENIIGKRRFIASNLDSLYSVLKNAKLLLDKDFYISIKNYNNFSDKRTSYLDEISNIFREFGVKILKN